MTQPQYGAHGTTFTPEGAPVVYDVLADRIVSRAIEDGVEKKRADVQSPKKIEFSSSYTPVFSPDGKQIVYVHEGQGQVGAYVMSADGSAQRVLFAFAGL